MLTVIAYIEIQPDKLETALEAAKELVENVKKEEGTLVYSLNQSSKDPNTLVFTEKYKDKEAFALHGSTEYFNDFMKKAASFAAKPAEVKVYKEIASI